MKYPKVGLLIVFFNTGTTLALISQLPSIIIHRHLGIDKSHHKPYPSPLLLSLFPQQQQQQQQNNNNYNEYILYNNINLIAKTNESFKLSDLYMMEANIQSNVREWDQSTQIIMDPNTGSCLFTLDRRFCSDDYTDVDDNDSGGVTSDYYVPSIIHRCDWICEILAFGHDINEFLNVIESSCSKNRAKWGNRNICLNNFSLDYLFMGKKTITCDNCQSYTSKSLSFRIVQLLSPAQSALDPNKASVKLLIIDTPKGIFLGLKRKMNIIQRKKNEELLKKWATRPFQYSSAMNPMIAMIVVDIIKDVTIQSQCKLSSLPFNTDDINENLSKTISMIDVTCGSGTFLAFSMDREMNVCGFDVNDKCVSGSNDNLEFLFGTEDTKDRSYVEIGDSSKNGNDDVTFDCAISNMPWGQNTNMNLEENKQILRCLRRKLKSGAYCAFVTKDDSLELVIESLGYKVIDSAHVPQKHFVLPSSKKGHKNKPDRGNSSDCVVTLAQVQ